MPGVQSVTRAVAVLCFLIGGCAPPTDEALTSAPVSPSHGDALEPDAAPRVIVDRFAARRADASDLPQPNEAIDFDARFTTRGFGPEGDPVTYYDFGPASGFTMPVFRLVDLDGAPVAGQLLIISAAPGEVGYSDFWQITELEVPEGYVANTITGAQEVEASDYPQRVTVEVLNRPVVPEGSSATRASGDGELQCAWLDDQVALAFDFSEAEVRVRGALVDYVPIYVCVTASGTFCLDADGTSHNVVGAIPSEPGYSPLWKPSVFPEASFDAVGDLESALAADPQPTQGLVNCPLVEW